MESLLRGRQGTEGELAVPSRDGSLRLREAEAEGTWAAESGSGMEWWENQERDARLALVANLAVIVTIPSLPSLRTLQGACTCGLPGRQGAGTCNCQRVSLKPRYNSMLCPVWAMSQILIRPVNN